MIWLSLHPSPAGETSAFNKTRAFKSRRAGLFPFRIKPSSRSCSSALSRTTYLFTDFSRVAIVPSVARSVTEANHQILSNWLKRATRAQQSGRLDCRLVASVYAEKPISLYGLHVAS